MGLPALLLDASSELERIAAVEDPRAPIEELIERTRRIESILKDIRIDESFAALEQSAMAAGSAGQADIEQLIGELHAREATLAAKFLPMVQATHTLRAKTFRARHLKNPEKVKHVLALERHAKVLISVLELFRDERWRIMMLLAKAKPAGDAPTFSDPQELEAYLDKL